MENATENLAETLAREIKYPVEIIGVDQDVRRVALPPGWKLEERNDEKMRDRPRRKTAKAQLNDADSFISYVKRHGSLANSTVWCHADYSAGIVKFKSILNDHGESDTEPSWRDHVAMYAPRFSEEWLRWNKHNEQHFSQAEFAEFLENNITDIASVDGSPTGAAMLGMALSFEANQDMRFKSAIRLQNGGVQMSFVQDDDSQTLQKMQMFDRFSIGIPVFWNGDSYSIAARLRYRVREGALTFWFELIRQDKVLEAATETLIQLIREKTGSPFFFGESGA